MAVTTTHISFTLSMAMVVAWFAVTLFMDQVLRISGLFSFHATLAADQMHMDSVKNGSFDDL